MSTKKCVVVQLQKKHTAKKFNFYFFYRKEVGPNKYKHIFEASNLSLLSTVEIFFGKPNTFRIFVYLQALRLAIRKYFLQWQVSE